MNTVCNHITVLMLDEMSVNCALISDNVLNFVDSKPLKKTDDKKSENAI